MEINTLNGTIFVVRKVYDNEGLEVNICKYKKLSEDKLYTIVILKSSNIIKKSIEFFYLLRENHKFDDFIECFSQNSKLYIVFKYHGDATINYEEVSEMPLMQRVEITKQLLSLIVLLDLPKEILYDIFSNNNINLNPNGKVYFSYYLKNIDMYEKVTEKHAIKKMGLFFRKIFPQELMNDSVKNFKELVYRCENGKYKNILDIYSDYVNNYKNFKESLNLKEVKEPNIFIKFLNSAMNMFNKVKSILIMIVLSAGIIYLIVNLTGKSENKTNKVIDSIGTQQFYKEKMP